MIEYIYPSVVYELIPLFGYGLIIGLGMALVLSALSWTVITFTRLMYKMT